LNWLTFSLTGSSFAVGMTNGARSIPLLLLGPIGGVMADRYDKKRLMLFTQLFQMVVTFLFAIVIVAGWVQIWHILVFSLVSGMAWALNMPVRQSTVPQMVPREDLMNAMALNSAGFNITRIIGPAIAGLMISTMGPGENFFIQSAAYLGVTVTVLQLTMPRTRSVMRDASVMANLKEGASYVWHHGTLRTQMALALVPVVVALPYISVLPDFNATILDGDEVTFGLMMGAPGLGAVVATLVLASLENVDRKGLLLLAAVFLLGISLILLSTSRSIWMALPLLTIVGATQMVYMTTNQTVVQLSTPEAYRGRVMGIYMLNQGMLPLGSLFAGGLADVFDASIALAIMGALVALLAMTFYARAGTIRNLVVT